ncbi:hypothetical protein GR160_01950 [Flavobacterium sp. Sd200]|uniref:hypothetical protein n=1 Tax=Flavobacterium sp. Sd200 TaxID=2692211 RepID=UPI00136B023E|nr:hypothetical protein [Flavobacterium sp. Sd200]MXN89975.1 hypothetical protein [Flavobacterium sp. Sd200]
MKKDIFIFKRNYRGDMFLPKLFIDLKGKKTNTFDGFYDIEWWGTIGDEKVTFTQKHAPIAVKTFLRFNEKFKNGTCTLLLFYLIKEIAGTYNMKYFGV